MSILINEWLPNPDGPDAENEWVELFNGGARSESLTGWVLQSGNGKKFSLPPKTLGSGEYLVITRPESKLTLRNKDEQLSLFDASGKLVDHSAFLGSAPQGESFARGGDKFSFAAPTPGQANVFDNSSAETAAVVMNQPLHPRAGTWEPVLLCLAAGVIISACFLFAIKQDHELSELFFGKN